MASGCGSLIMVVDQQFQRCGLWTEGLTAPSALAENNTQQGTPIQHNSYNSVVTCAM